MKSSCLAAALLVFPIALASAQDAEFPADFANVVPTDAFALVRANSLRELEQHLEQARSKAGLATDKGDSPFVEKLLKQMNFKGDQALVDRARPIGFALSFAKNSPMPVPT